MRQFATPFDALRYGDYATYAWTAEFMFPGGSRQFGTMPLAIDGVPYKTWIRSLGTLGGISSERRATLSVSEARLSLVNLPDVNTGELFSGMITPLFESVITKLRLHFVDDQGNDVSALMFVGVPQSPEKWDEADASITLQSLSERYLSRQALRTLSDTEFPGIRSSDIGATVPIVVGIVPSIPGRVAQKGSSAEISSDAANTGTGQLREAIVGGSAVDEVWTIEFTTTETQEFEGPQNSSAELGRIVGTTIGALSPGGTHAQPSIVNNWVQTKNIDTNIHGQSYADVIGPVPSGGSNRQLLITVMTMSPSADPTISQFEVSGSPVTAIMSSATTLSGRRYRITMYRLANPASGFRSIFIEFDQNCLAVASFMVLQNVNTSLSFIERSDAMTSGVGGSTSVTDKVISGPAFLALGCALSSATNLGSGGGQSRVGFGAVSGTGGLAGHELHGSTDIRDPAATSSGTSSPGDPETCSMSWSKGSSSVTLFARFLTIRGVTSGDTSVTAGGSTINFTVPAGGLTVTSVAALVYRDFPTDASIQFQIDNSNYGAVVTSIQHGPNGTTISATGNVSLNAGGHTLKLIASGSAQVFRKTTGWQVSGGYVEIFSQSMQTAADQLLVGVEVFVGKNGSFSGDNGRLVVGLRTNDGSDPESEVELATASVTISETTPDWVRVAFPVLSIPDSTPYWFVARADADGNGRGSVLWYRRTTGGYANGNANYGRALTSGTPDLPGPINWQGGISSQDFLFRALFAEDTYTFDGTVSGSQGGGQLGADSVSNDGRIRIPSTAFLGQPAAGDKFYVTVTVADGQVIVCESPDDTPIQALGGTYWNGRAINEAGGTLLDIDDVDEDAAIGTGGAVQGQTMRWDVNQLLKELRLPLKKAGSPPGTSIAVQIVEGNAAGTAPGETATVFGNFQVPISAIDTSYDDQVVSFADNPIFVPAGQPIAYILSNPDGGTAGNEVYIARSTSDPYADGNAFSRSNAAAGGWVANAQNDLNVRVIGVEVTKELSVDDGTGNYVARVSFDCQLPDSVITTFDVEGITDDDSGTYTGSPGSLIRVPSDFVHWCLAHQMTVPAEYVDVAGTFSATKAKHGALYRFDGALIDPQDWRRAILRIGFQSRATFDWTGILARLIYIDSTPPAIPSAVFGPAEILKGDNNGFMVDPTRTDTDDLVNDVEIKWSRRWNEARGEQSYDRAKKFPEADSIGDGDEGFGSRTGEQGLFWFDLVRKDDMAEDLGEFYRSRFAFPKERVSATGTFPLLAVEVGDVIRFDLLRSPIATRVLKDRPFGYWRMKDSTTTMVDETTNGRNGTHPGDAVLERPSLVTDPDDYSVQYIGTGGSTVDLPTIGAEWWIEAWFNATAEEDGLLVGCSQVELRRIDAETIRLSWLDSGAVARSLDLDVDMELGETYYVVGTHDGQRATIMLFDALDDANAIAIIRDSTYDSDVVAADTWEFGGDDFEGRVDEVAIGDRELSVIRAMAHFKGGTFVFDE